MTNGKCSGIIAVMRMFLAIIFFAITVSVACTSSRSEGPLRAANTNSQSQTPIATTNVTAQEKQKCELTRAGAPDIKGLKLGMTPDEVLALFPGSKDDAELKTSLAAPPNRFGGASFLIEPEKYKSKDRFAGITRITFTTLDGSVSSLNVGYNGPEYSHVDKFVARFIEGTNLPAADQWEAYVGLDTQMKTLKCVDFELRVFAGGPGGNLNYVLVKDLEAEKKLKDRKDKARAKATPTP